MVDIDELERLLAAADKLAANMAEIVKEWERDEPRDDWFLHQHDHADAVEMLNAQSTAIRELRAENARLRMANRSLRRGLYGLTDSGDADEIATTLEAGGVVDWDKYPPNARAALGEPQ